MTCIIGISYNNKIYLGGDTQGTGGHSKTMRVDGKVFKKGEFGFGFTSSYRMGQVLRYAFSPPEHPEEMENMEYLVCKFIPALMDTYKEASILYKHNEVASGGTFLMGYRGTLYRVESDWQVGIPECKYDACGSGEDLARGAMFALVDNHHMGPQDKITKCLDAAAAFNSTVGGRYEIIEL